MRISDWSSDVCSSDLDRPLGVNLAAGVAGDQADDAFDLGAIDPDVRIDAAFAQYIDAQRTIGIDHHLDDARIGKRGGDCRPHRRAQHRAAAFARNRGAAHPASPSTCAAVSVRLPPTIWRPSWAMKRSNRSLPTERAALSASGSGAVTVSW